MLQSNADPSLLAQAEAALTASITRQGEVFAQTIRLVEQIQNGLDLRDPASQPAVQQLQKSLELVTMAQSEVTRSHQRLQQLGHPLSAAMRQLLSSQESRLAELLERITRVQQAFEHARAELLPRLDAESRRRSMQSAYQQSLRTV